MGLWPRDRERRLCWRPSHYNLKSTLNVYWKGWCWSRSSNTLASWCEELTHCQRPWCRERLKTGGEGDDRGWDGWMASLTRWTWVWASSVRWWRTGKPAVLQFIGSQRIGHDRRTTHKISFPTSEDTNTFTQELPWKQGGDRCLALLCCESSLPWGVRLGTQHLPTETEVNLFCYTTSCR